MLLATGLLIGVPHAGLDDDRFKAFVLDFGSVALGLTATMAAWRVSARPGVEAPLGRAWRRLALAFGCWAVGDLVWLVYEVGLQQTPFPSPADLAYLAFYPCAAWALLSFPSAARRRSDWTKMGLDALTVLLCAAMGIWYLVIGPTVHDNPGGQSLALALNLAYPVGDLLVLFGVVVNLMRRTAVMDGAFRALVAGVTALVVADVSFARLSLSGTYEGGGWPDLFWAAAWFLFFAATRLAPRPGDDAPSGDGHPAMAGRGRPQPPRPEQPLARLPYLAVGLAYALLLVVGRRAAVYPLDGLILGAAAVTAIVLIRQVHMISENGRLMSRLQNLANIDPLTNLPNRRAFFEDAGLLFDGGLGNRRHSILMVDVDYFKAVNDTFGHSAGDRVLSIVAACVMSQLRSADLVGRYGGDELVIALADCDAAAAVAVAERIRSVVAATPVVIEDQVVNVTLSIGAAGGEPHDALVPLLARADLALYDAKRAGRACVREFAAAGSQPG